MKKFIIVLVCCLCANVAVAANISEIYEEVFIEDDIIRFVEIINGNDYYRFRLKDGTWTIANRETKVSAPEMPYKNLMFVIPDGATNINLSIVNTESSVKEIDERIIPAQTWRILSDPATTTEPDEKIYGSNKPYPEKIVQVVKLGKIMGRTVVAAHIFPFQYVPASGQIIQYHKVNIELTYGINNIAAAASTATTTNSVGDKFLGNIIANPEKLPVKTLMEDEKILFIISSAEILNNGAIDDYCVVRKSQGWTILEKKVEDIPSQYEGRDIQEKARNCIKEYYLKYGSVSVLILGDKSILPFRTVASTLLSLPFSSELYYSCLEGTWDANGNGVYGEREEDDPDMYPDIFFGRLQIKTPLEAEATLQAVLIFEKQAPALLALWGCSDYGAGPMMIDKVKSLLPSWWLNNVSTITEGKTPYYSREALNIINKRAWNIGHVDHGGSKKIHTGDTCMEGEDPRICDYISITDVDELMNDRKPILFNSVACNIANQYSNDNIVDHFFEKGISAAVIANTCYGIHPQNDQELLPEFFNIWLNQKMTLGETFNAHKLKYIPGANPPMEYCLKQLTLFGDPTMGYENRDIIPGDFDRDNDVDGSDLAIFSANFGRTDCQDCEGDFNQDEDVDGSDLAIFVASFGSTKP